MLKWPKISVICLFAISLVNSTVGQNSSIPSTPYEAKIWLKSSSNSYEENELGQVVRVKIEYVPRVFVVGDLEVFPHLEWLQINYSRRFYDRHMSGIARLKGLKKLSILRCGEITEASLAVLRYVPQLEELELVDVGSLLSLAPLTQCTSLKKLIFSNNSHFDFMGLKKISQLPNLEELVLESNHSLEDRHLESLGTATKLKKLSLRDSREITDGGLRVLSLFKELQWLDLSKCPGVTGTALAEVNDGLETLRLDNSDVSDDGVQHLGRLKNLKQLRLNTNERITEASLFAIENCEFLESLNLSGLPIAKKHFEKMNHFKKLKKLNLAGCQQATGDGVGLLAQCGDLEEIDFSSCRRIDSPDMIPLAQFKKLKTLVLRGTRVNADGIVHLQELENLETIDLSGCKWIDDEAVAALAEVLSLKKVLLNDISRITDESLRQLGKLPRLEEIYLSHNLKITGAGLAGFSGSSPLKRLEMKRVDSLTPAGLRNLTKLSELENLDIHCKKLTNEHILAMMGLPSLKSFDLDDTDAVDRNVLRKWINSLPSYGK